MKSLLWLVMLVTVSSWADVDPKSSFYEVRPASISCVIQAAEKQGVAANVLLAISSIESGKNGQAVGNKNGSKDLGHFQINTIHWKPNSTFTNYPEITQESVLWRGCYNAELAAWLLRKAIDSDESKDYWTRVANYHSRTPKYNAIYRKKLIPLAVKWADYLKATSPDVLVSYQ